MPNLVDVTMFYAPEGGGVRRYLKAKQDWFSQQPGWSHSLLVPGSRKSHAEPRLTAIASPRIPFANGYRFAWRGKPWREALLRLEPDLIEAGDPYQLAWLSPSVAREMNVPVIGFYLSDLARLIQQRIGGWPLPAINAYLHRLYSGFDRVFAPSLVMCDKLRAIGLDRVVHQPLGVDTRLFNPARRDPALRKQLGLPEDTRLCIFAGRFAREKNIPLLLAAFKRLGSPYHLLLVGSGMRLPAQRNVTVMRYRSSATNLARLIASCDLLVHAGDQETFGLIVLEAMACGIPVVGVNAGALPELIDDCWGALAQPGKAADLAAAIESVYARDPARLGLAAAAKVQSEYTWAQIFARQKSHYLALLGAKESRDQDEERALVSA